MAKLDQPKVVWENTTAKGIDPTMGNLKIDVNQTFPDDVAHMTDPSTVCHCDCGPYNFYNATNNGTRVLSIDSGFRSDSDSSTDTFTLVCGILFLIMVLTWVLARLFKMRGRIYDAVKVLWTGLPVQHVQMPPPHVTQPPQEQQQQQPHPEHQQDSMTRETREHNAIRALDMNNKKPQRGTRS